MKVFILMLCICINAEPLYFKPKDLFCPDSKSTCPTDSTCCPLPSEEYGCCNRPNAVCCLDKRHCCPKGMLCDLKTSSCVNSTDSLSLNTIPFISKNKKLNGVECPDKTECEDEQTCCLLATGVYGCCPLLNAICCDDYKHCCPSGTTCDVPHQMCIRGAISIPWMKKLKSNKKLEDVICPDSSYCQDNQTCCETGEGEYACCPLPKAECCSDYVHCCPSGTTCDVEHESCLTQHATVKWAAKVPAKTAVKQPKQDLRDVTCPDKLSFCQNDQTCCILLSGQYGCCPYPQAICCSDDLHCCPKGTVCDIDEGTCIAKFDSAQPHSLTTITLVAQALAKKKLENVICPDSSYCQDNQTCCKMEEGRYACCPLPNAECCSDYEHCCPSGTTCDVEHESCLTQLATVKWATKVPAKTAVKQPKQDLRGVICPDKMECRDNQTCCIGRSGKYHCCSYPQGVCCSDNIHCCKHGQKCDVPARRCVRTKILEQKPWKSLLSLRIVQCDDSQYCKSGETCCSDGTKFTCCPFNKGECCGGNTCCQQTCFFFHLCLPSDTPSKTSAAYKMNLCSDKLHFCDMGFDCDLTSGTCIRTSQVFDYWTKTDSMNVIDQRKCAGSNLQCPADQKCCQNKYRGQGCCPFINGVCCESGFECCPEGTYCSHDGRCTNPTGSISLSPTTLRRTITKNSIFADPIPEGNDKCADKSFCPTDTTCCLQMDGQFGCCQYPNAMCCEDKIHCCPNGYICDVAHQQCKEAHGKLPFNLPWNVFTRNKAKFLP